jgi:hypothetical protein
MADAMKSILTVLLIVGGYSLWLWWRDRSR